MLLGLWLSVSMAFAETTSDIEVLVKGMVCSFCVQGVEKYSGEDVEKVEVNWMNRRSYCGSKTIKILLMIPSTV